MIPVGKDLSTAVLVYATNIGATQRSLDNRVTEASFVVGGFCKA